jgi:hypothetical protein
LVTNNSGILGNICPKIVVIIDFLSYVILFKKIKIVIYSIYPQMSIYLILKK